MSNLSSAAAASKGQDNLRCVCDKASLVKDGQLLRRLVATRIGIFSIRADRWCRWEVFFETADPHPSDRVHGAASVEDSLWWPYRPERPRPRRTADGGPPGPFDRIKTSKIGKFQKIPAASHAVQGLSSCFSGWILWLHSKLIDDS